MDDMTEITLMILGTVTVMTLACIAVMGIQGTFILILFLVVLYLLQNFF